jgi:hypothetical protein
MPTNQLTAIGSHTPESDRPSPNRMIRPYSTCSQSMNNLTILFLHTSPNSFDCRPLEYYTLPPFSYTRASRTSPSFTSHARLSVFLVYAEIDSQAHSEWEAAAEAGLGVLRQSCSFFPLTPAAAFPFRSSKIAQHRDFSVQPCRPNIFLVAFHLFRLAGTLTTFLPSSLLPACFRTCFIHLLFAHPL